MNIKLLLVSLYIALYAINSQAQTCKSYISDKWPDSRYTDNNNGTITDNETNLTWKQCAEGLSGAGCTSGTLIRYKWKQALQLADSTSFAGHSDWRLPNIKELNSLATANCYSPSINESLFPNTPSFYFWSSTSMLYYQHGAWNLRFTEGRAFPRPRYHPVNVRLVRGTSP